MSRFIPAMNAKKVLFVCLGNICRSPMAEGLFQAYARETAFAKLTQVDSAGTAGWHQGKSPHPLSIEAAAEAGIDISGQQSRPVNEDDFHRFDLILAMDRSNLADLKRMASKFASTDAEIDLLANYAGRGMTDIADPYGEPISAYRKTAHILLDMMPVVLHRLHQN